MEQLADTDRHWKWNLFLMWSSQLLILGGFAAVMPFIPLFMKNELGLTDERILGVWVSMFNFFGSCAYAIFCPIWGALSDRFGMKPMLLRGTFGTALIFPLMGYVHHAWLLVLLRFLSAACAGTTAASQTLLVKNTPENKQGFALGVLSTAIWGGTMLGNVVGGLVVHYYGYKFAFTVCGIMYFLAGFIVLLAHEDFKPVAKAASGHGGNHRHFTGFRGLPQFTTAVWMLLGIMLFTGFARYFEIPYLAMLVEKIVGENEAASFQESVRPLELVEKIVGENEAAYWTGIICGAVAVGALLSGMLTGYLSDRVKPLYILVPSMGISVATMLIQAATTNLWVFGVSRTLMYLAAGGTVSVIQKLLSAATPKRKRGKVFGFCTTANGVGIMLSTVAAGGVIYVTGVRGVFYTAAFLLLLLIPCHIAVFRRIMRQRYFAAHYKAVMARR